MFVIRSINRFIRVFMCAGKSSAMMTRKFGFVEASGALTGSPRLAAIAPTAPTAAPFNTFFLEIGLSMISLRGFRPSAPTVSCLPRSNRLLPRRWTGEFSKVCMQNPEWMQSPVCDMALPDVPVGEIADNP